MTTKEKAIHFYKLGLYSKEQFHMFVVKGVITEEKYKEIVGEA